MLNVNRHTPTNWSQLREWLRNRRGWAFRGQADCSWGLVTHLERVTSYRACSSLNTASAEAILLGAFKRGAESLLSDEPLPHTTIEWLALMQHHGAATRLLDFTLSPYVAAYFAIEDPTLTCDRAIWAIDIAAIREKAAALLVPHVKDFAKQILAIQDWADGDMTPCRVALPCAPSRAHRRLASQQGIFMVPGYLGDSFEKNLEHTCDGELAEHVQCYLMPSEWRGEVIEDLRKMNITRASLFPGLDGFSQSLNIALTSEEDALRAIRLASGG